MTLPRAVFLKNFRWVTTASPRGRLRIVISTIVEGVVRRVCGRFRTPSSIVSASGHGHLVWKNHLPPRFLGSTFQPFAYECQRRLCPPPVESTPSLTEERCDNRPAQCLSCKRHDLLSGLMTRGVELRPKGNTVTREAARKIHCLTGARLQCNRLSLAVWTACKPTAHPGLCGRRRVLRQPTHHLSDRRQWPSYLPTTLRGRCGNYGWRTMPP